MNGHAVGGITNGACRRFINESFATFQKTPKGIDAQFVDDSQRLDLTRCSEQFRSHLRRLADAVSSAAELVDIEGVGTSDSASLEQDYDLLYSIEKSWHICEIFTINPTKTLSIELVKWLKVCIRASVACWSCPDPSASLHCRKFATRPLLHLRWTGSYSWTSRRA
jgi:hypothetical protein